MYYLNPRVENLYRIFDQNERKDYLRLDLNENPGGLPEDKMVSFSYYVTVFAYAIVTYLIGMSDYTALKKTFSYLNTIRNKYNV